MPYSAQKTEILSLLQSVTGIGQVYDRIRFYKDRAGKIQIMVTSGSVFHVWFMRRTAVSGIPRMDAISERTMTWDLIGFYEVGDSDTSDNASETIFQGIVDAVMDKFDAEANLQLNNAGDLLIPAELISFDDVEVGDTLAHRAIIRIHATEFFEG